MFKNLIYLIIIVAVAFFLYNRFRVPPKIDFLELSTTDLEGNPVDLNDYFGENILITMWAPWCGDCIKEMPGLQFLSDNTDLKIIAISGYDIEKEKRFKEKNNYNFIYLHMDEKLKEVGVHSIPTNYILNKKGEVVYKKVGTDTWFNQETIEEVKKLID